ncbi:3688_t:CDS:10, partial [Racocetra persica]
RLRSACKFYLQALSDVEDADDAEVTIWEEGRYECFEKLSKWDDLAETVYVDIDSDLDKLWDQDFQFVKLTYGQNDKSYCGIFFNFIDRSLSDPDRKSFLTAQYLIEQSLFYIRKAYDNFLFMQSTLHPLASSTRLSKLIPLQQIVEIGEYLNLSQSSEESEKWEKLISHWKNRYPSKRLDPSNSWDDIITSRHSLLGAMMKSLQEDMTLACICSLVEIKNSPERDGLLKMASTARVQGNFEVARVCLNKTRQSKLYDNNEMAYYQLKLNLHEALTVNIEKKLSILVAMTDEFKKVEKAKRMQRYNLLKDAAEEAISHLKVSFDSRLYASTVVKYVLKATEDCSKEASELFPRLLQIICIYDNTQSIFKQMGIYFVTEEKWILGQTNPLHNALFQYKYNLAEQYQKGLYYPLKISSEHYNFDEKSKKSEINKSRTVWSLIRSKTTEIDGYEEIKKSFQKMRTFLLDIQNPHYGL